MQKRSVVYINDNNFKTILQSKATMLYTLKNKAGMVAEITNYGARVVSLWVPDVKGNFDDLVLGFDCIEDYVHKDSSYFGATVGRYANRISKAQFTIDGEVYHLAKNVGSNSLHGGVKGFHAVVWDAIQTEENRIELSYFSQHLEEGFPGNLQVKLVYTLTNDNELKIEYQATTDRITVINLTHHSYFNLKGAGKGQINDHHLTINAKYYTPVTDELIPTGELKSVKNSCFDFTQSKLISEQLKKGKDVLDITHGFDHNYVIERGDDDLNFTAKVEENQSGRVMEVFTDQPGVQFYGGNFIDETVKSKRGIYYQRHGGLCLETQHFPDSPNQRHFPSTFLKPETQFNSVTVYKFSTKII